MMYEELTQASTLAVEEEVISDEEKLKGCWGILKSLNPAYPDIYLKDIETPFGRYPNLENSFNDKNISGLHCKIIRESDAESDGTVIAFVHDCSTNGTYLDGIKIGRGEKRLLIANAELSLTIKKPDRIAFLFQLPEREDSADGPQKKYLFGEQLGAGNFATVKLAVERKTGSKYAVKIIDKKKYFMNAGSRKDSLMDEVKILRDLHHPNIIHIYEVFDTDKTLYLILELVESGELLNDIIVSGFYSEEKAKALFGQIVEGVLYLHRKGIAHRDLKPENILLKHKNYDQADSIKLSDFGLSRTISEGSFMKTMCGTPQYLAPEILTNNSNGVGGYGLEVDCWSMGAILYVMLCGYPPFDDNKDTSIFEQIRKALFDFNDEVWEKVSDEAKDLIKRLLCVDPQKRYTCEQILKHPWYNENIKLSKLLEKENEELKAELEKSRLKNSNSSLNIGNNSNNSSEDSPSMLGKRKSNDALNININDNTTFKSNIQTESQSLNYKKSKSDPLSSTSSSSSLFNTKDESNDDDDTDDETISLPVLTKNSKSMSNINNTINSSMNLNSSNSNINTDSTTINTPINTTTNANTNTNTNTNTNINTNTNSSNNNVKNEFPVPFPKSPSKPSSPPLQNQSPNSSPTLASTSNHSGNNHNKNNNNSNNSNNNQLPPCKYGSNCYRKNPHHFKEYSH